MKKLHSVTGVTHTLTALSQLPSFTSCFFQWLLGNATVAALKKNSSLVAFCPSVLFTNFNEIMIYKDVEH